MVFIEQKVTTVLWKKSYEKTRQQYPNVQPAGQRSTAGTFTDNLLTRLDHQTKSSRQLMIIRRKLICNSTVFLSN